LNLSAPDLIRRVAFSGDSRFLAVPTEPGVVKLFEAPSYREVARLALSERELQDLEFTPDGAWLLAGATDGSASFRQPVGQGANAVTIVASRSFSPAHHRRHCRSGQ
jgi:WD40 repeat protein